MKKELFNVTGMTCSACSAHVEKAVNKIDGVKKVTVNLLRNNMYVTFDEEKTTENTIADAVIKAGYNASLSEVKKETTPKNNLSKMKTRLILSIIFTIPLFYLSMGHMMNFPLPNIFHNSPIIFAFTQFLLTIPVAFINKKFFITGFKNLIKRTPTMDSLIALGSSAAILYGIISIYQIGYGIFINDTERISHYAMNLYFESAAMILTLITLGKFLESRAKEKTSNAITKLIDLRPKTALIEKDGTESEVLVSNLKKGDIVIVKPGQTIPVDGIITDGVTSVDESMLTGESIPVLKEKGSEVISATINKNGYIKFKATKVGDDTTLSQIIRLIEEASSSKAPIAKLADRISSYFVPAVILISVLAFIIWILSGKTIEFALNIAISVLVISCPCALGLATPTAIMVGIGQGAKNGILIKSAESLEIMHSADTVILDKTGTLTEAKPIVTDIIPLNGFSSQKLLSLAFSLENLSEHPLATAITDYAKKNNVPLLSADNFTPSSGLGVSADIENEKTFAGNIRFLKENNIPLDLKEDYGEKLSESGKTPLYFAVNNKLAGIIAVAAPIKSNSKTAVNTLKDMGVEVIILTGDNHKTAKAIGKELGIKTVISELLPQDKEKEITSLRKQNKKVVMVGDGINDAPALASADVGIAIGAGSDIAIESADVVLVKSNLNDIVTLFKLSKAVMKNIKQNLFWALIYNSLGIPLAAGVFYTAFALKLNPMFGAAAMSLSSVCVITNALRLKFFKLDKKGEKAMKTITIEGMMCSHCSMRVENILNDIEGVNAKVNLEEKTALIDFTKEISDDILINAIETAGYKVTSIN